MRVSTSIVYISLALIASSKAQFPTGLLSGVSSECLGGLASLATNPALDECLHFNEALTAFNTAGSGSSVVPALNTYLGEEFCPGVACSSSTLTEANNTLTSSCASDSQNATSIVSALTYLFTYYDEVRAAFCLRDTTQNNELCSIQTLNNMQNAANANFTITTISALNANTLAPFVETLGEVNQAQLCSDCNKAIVFTMQPTLNSSVFAQRLASNYTSQCGNLGVAVTLRQSANGTSTAPGSIATSENGANTIKVSIIAASVAGAIASVFAFAL